MGSTPWTFMILFGDDDLADVHERHETICSVIVTPVRSIAFVTLILVSNSKSSLNVVA